jgi:hypothetical protein
VTLNTADALLTIDAADREHIPVVRITRGSGFIVYRYPDLILRKSDRACAKRACGRQPEHD